MSFLSADRRSSRLAASAVALTLLGSIVASVPLLPVDAATGDSSPMAIWRRSGQSTPFTATWDGTNFGSTLASASVGDFRIMQGAEAPTRDEAIVVGVDASGTIAGERWDGTTWSTLPTLGATSQTFWWGAEVAYEASSGEALVVYVDGAALNYRTWDGSTWSAEGPVPEPPGGTPRQLRLAAHPSSDEMTLVVSNDASHDYAVVWDGAAWGNGITLEATGSGNDRTDVFVTYEQQSGEALVVYGSGSGDIHHRTWNGASWESESILAGIGGGYARWTTLGADPTSDRIGLGVLTNDADVWFAIWDGTGWIDQVTATTTSTGTTELPMAVAFESASGQAVASYGETGNQLLYRTWASGSGWSGSAKIVEIGATTNSMVLEPDPASDAAMLVVQDDNSDLHWIPWSGSAWGADNVLETSSGETKNQPFLHLWNSAEPATGSLDSVILDDVQSGTAILADGSSTTTVTIAAVDPSRSMLTYSLRGSDSAPSNLSINGVLSDPTTVTFSRIGTSSAAILEWSVVEFVSGVTVQRGTEYIPNGGPIDLAIAPVDLSRSFVLANVTGEGNAFGVDDFVIASLTSSTNLRLDLGNGLGSNVAWQVVQYNDAVVQRGTNSLASGDASRTATVTTVDLAKSWLVYSYSTVDGDPNDIGQKLVRGLVSDPTTLTFDRSSTGQTVDLSWELVEFTDDTIVRHASAAFSGTDSVRDVTIAAVNPARSIAVGGTTLFGGRSSYTSNDNPGVGWFTTELTSSTNLRIRRGAALAPADLGWFVIHWPVACVDSDDDGLCDLEEDADIDADGDPATNPGPDTDGDLSPDYLDPDDDGDGIPTAGENADPNFDGDPRDASDTDRDGEPDYLDDPTVATVGTVAGEQKISDTAGGFTPNLADGAEFGRTVESIGDIDGDGVVDLAAGVWSDNDGGPGRGAVYVLFMNTNGTVKSQQKISDTSGGLAAGLDDGDQFGHALAGLGDLDGDGTPDLAASALRDDDGGTDRGAVHILFLNPDGTVKAQQKISDISGGLSAILDNDDQFGHALGAVGDVDGDGLPDLVAGARLDDDGGADRGAIYVLLLGADGTVRAEGKISDTAGGFVPSLDNGDRFGMNVDGLGDMDHDGVPDLVVGAAGDDDGGADRGAIYVVLLQADGTVKDARKTSSTTGGISPGLADSDEFGFAVAGVGDLDLDGVPDAAIGTRSHDAGGPDRGAVWVALLSSDGTVKSTTQIAHGTGGLIASLDDGDGFGAALTSVGDLDGDGTVGLAVGAGGDDDGGSGRGAIYVLDLDPVRSTISGTVFEDIAGDLLTDGAIGSAADPGSVGVDVHLWDGTNSLIASTVTDGSGNYSFTGLADGDYTVFVDSRTVPSAQDPGALQGDIWAEQTYGPTNAPCANGLGLSNPNAGAGSCYAGITSMTSDSIAVPLHRVVIPLSGADVSDVDFGFSFNVVTNSRGGDATDDDGTANRTVQGSLRQFVQNANAIAGPNAMRFVPTEPSEASLGADEWWRIAVTNPLPVVSAADTTIDGTALRLDDGTTLVDTNSLGPEFELDGTGSAVGDDGLLVTGGTATIRGLAINRFGRDGIRITTTGSNTIVGNYIGTDAIGAADAGNGGDGLRIISTGDNQIGGTNMADRNVISGNTNGVLIDGAAAIGNIVEGNLIGTNAIGDGPVPNATGVAISGGANTNTIGGTSASARNVISGNTGYGIDINGAGSDLNTVSANHIGTDVAGTSDLGNLSDGVAIRSGSRGNTIGGPTAGERNTIAGNDNDGVWITGIGTDDNTVAGNWIGFGPDGSNIGNSYHGVAIENGAAGNLVGGDGPADQNRIGNSGWDGVTVAGGGTGNAIVGNSIVANGDLGIDLAGGIEDSFGVTANGTGVTNHPVVTAATEAAGTVTIDFDLDAPAGGYRVEVFTNASGFDPSGYGEGEAFQSAATINHTGSGVESFQIVYAGSPGDLIALTTTDEAAGPLYGTTSEFSAGFTVAGTPNSTISGSVVEDVDGDGDILDDGTGVVGVQVWVFADQGNGEPDAGDPVARTTVTDGSGDWSVTVDTDGTYWVAVDSTDIEPAAGYNVTFSRDDVWADQTYGSSGAVTYDGTSFSFEPTTGPLFGGKQAAAVDGFPSLAKAEHLHRVVVSGADVTGVDSGFSFQVVTNTTDELDPGTFATAATWDAYDPGANGVGTDPDGYRGLADDGRYLYFAPYGDGVTYRGEVLRYDTTGAFTSAGSWSTFDPGSNGVGATPIGYAGALFDGRYIFFSPYGSRHGEVLRYDTQAPFATTGSWSTFDPGSNGVGTDPDGYLGLTWDGRFVYFSPYNNGSMNHGEVLRYDTQATFAATGSWETFDPGANGVGTDPDGFVGAGFDGRYVYFVPFHNGTASDGEVLRYDTQATFAATGSWETFDPGANGVGTAPDGFAGAVFDGRYLYFVPSENAGGRHGEVLRYDVEATFSSAGSWETFDPGANGVGVDPDGFRGATYDGRYVYFVPFDNGSGRHGEVLRYDTAASFDTAASWSTFDAGANGVGIDPDGYSGAVFTGRHVFFGPTDNGTGAHGEVLRYDTGRTGQGSMRQFIENSEAVAGSQASRFSIPTDDPGYTASPLAYTIRSNGALPTISDTVTIDGTTQPGFPGTPIIELDGSLTPTATALTLTSPASTIRGLVINRFATGIDVLDGSANVIAGNFIGTDVTGSIGQVGNTTQGIYVYGATGTIIGGTDPGNRNVISGNRLRGVLIDDLSDGPSAISSGTRVIGNYIGTNASGAGPLPFNGIGGVQQIGVYVLDSPANDIGGPGPEGNVISGNDWNGVYVWGPNATGNTIQGNIIGLDESGTFAVGNGADNPATRSGVTLSNAPGNLVGGSGAGEANTIAGNDAKGVIVGAPGAVDNAIVANRIHSNAGIGIDLAGGAENSFGVTSNDTGDSGPNGLLDYPVITSATASGPIVTVRGTFDVPAGSYRFDFFTNPSGGDPSGYGEGEVLVGTATLSHSGAGPQAFGGAFIGSVGDEVSVTITEESVGPVFGSTSEFSATVTVVEAGGTAMDSSGRRSDVVGRGGVDLDTAATGLIANGFDLAGGPERLVGPATDMLASELTLSGWVRLDAAGVAPRIVAKAANDGSAIYELLIDDGTGEAVARMNIGGSTVEARGGAVPTGSWHQLAATWDGSTVVLYVDGSQVDTAAGAGALGTDLTVPLVIGNIASADRGVDGRLDQIEVDHVARSSDRIATSYANLSNPAAFVSMGAVQVAAPRAWTVSTSLGRTGSNSLSAPETAPGADAWATAIGIDEPGVEFVSWWYISDPSVVTVAGGSRTGVDPTDQNETALSAAGFDLATIVGPARTQEATSPSVVGGGIWAEVTLRTDQLGVSSVWLDGFEILGPTAHTGGAATGSVGLRTGGIPVGERWNIDDVRLRRFVSDEPLATLGPLDRN